MLESLQVFGRLHALVVHLPIGIFFLIGLMELAGLFRPSLRLSSEVRLVVLLAAFGAAVLAASLGWALAADGDYNPSLLERHRWLGLATAALGGLLLLLARNGGRWYAGALAAALFVLTAAGHYGGSLTHGSDYLAALLPGGGKEGGATPPADPSQARVFSDLVAPVLKTKCVSCHGPDKSNGDLRLDTFDRLVEGGKNGASLVPGSAEKSLLLHLVYLPFHDKRHMPPKGKPQLTDDEFAILEWWIDSGASRDATVATLRPPPDLAELINDRLGVPRPVPPNREYVLASARELEHSLSISIRPLTAELPLLGVTARWRGAEFTDEMLAQLEPIAPAIWTLDLGETAVTDEGLISLAAMSELRTLQLDGTAVSDAGLSHLAGLSRLKSLNLHDTSVGDAGLAELATLQRLRHLYLWKTNATPAGARRLAEAVQNRRRLVRLRDEILSLERDLSSETFTAAFGAELLLFGPEPALGPEPAGSNSEAKQLVPNDSDAELQSQPSATKS